MAKNVFRYNEFINKLENLVAIKSPQAEAAEEVEELEPLEEYTGPTAEDLRKEAEEFREQWQSEKALMIQESQIKAEEIIQAAQASAFEIIKKEQENAAKIKIDAERDYQNLMEQAKKESQVLDAQARTQVHELENNAKKKGHQEGFEAGYKEGEEEVRRLVDRMHLIIQKVIEKRSDIIEGAETQVVNLVLLIARKVIKVISENQRNVVINNVVQALRKLKTRGDVVIRVNLEDLKLTSDNTKEFIKMVENVKSISVIEDSSVDPGGCVVETDFGQIDARIASQLHEIEEKVRELMPIKSASAGEPPKVN
ncbi:MAG: flagellar assembly protein FliH [Spirochaetes bacterium GWB1_48_6]|nr:MAG: flagellar assembly protein FliH [Spirochaetes bacterium GWB1_48_6]